MRIEPTVEPAARSWIDGGVPPQAAHNAEEEVVSDVIGKDTLGDQPCHVAPDVG
jgi:hypothetical protein